MVHITPRIHMRSVFTGISGSSVSGTTARTACLLAVHPIARVHQLAFGIRRSVGLEVFDASIMENLVYIDLDFLQMAVLYIHRLIHVDINIVALRLDLLSFPITVERI